MPLTLRELNRATLARQLLLAREPLDVPTAVRRVTALQAQEPASPYIALWNRIDGLDARDVDAAFADATIVKATLIRITLHAVHADDHPAFHAAMQPSLRSARLHDRRYRDTGRTPAEADALVEDLRAHLAEPRTNADVEAWLTDLGVPAQWTWWAMRQYAPVRHAVTGGPWSFGPRPAHVAADAPTPDPGDLAGADRALESLVVRYLEAFGPATVADIGRFALVQRSRVRIAVAALGDRLIHLTGPSGPPLLDVPDGVRPPADVPAPPRLLGMWESILLSHADRTRVLPEAHRTVVIRRNGDTLPTVLVDGMIVGVWRAVEGGIEVTPLEPIADEGWDGLASEAAALTRFLADREPLVYGRYHRWWDSLPSEGRRVLAG